ncbi:4-hydroxy-tetrahydrodipicolinate reductase [Mesorhizobium sp. M1423]|uniref:4-hydroxy-tetrahydrodipicolinate reductase n=1 Tax=Mesorhizobium sp. M1423 TaxID=2957101 RepID=UPI0033365889
MALRIVLAGASGWVGQALALEISRHPDFALVAAVARRDSGRKLNEVVAGFDGDLFIVGTLEEALATPSEVLIDYTRPEVVKKHTLEALAAGHHVVIGTSGLNTDDYAEIDSAAQSARRGVVAAGNFSVTATLLRRFALEAARFLPEVEVVEWGSAGKHDVPSGTGMELADHLAQVRTGAALLGRPEYTGRPEARGAAIGRQAPVQVHSVRLPSYTSSTEVMFGADGERLSIRQDAGSSAMPYVAGTLLAAQRVVSIIGLRRGLDSVM